VNAFGQLDPSFEPVAAPLTYKTGVPALESITSAQSRRAPSQKRLGIVLILRLPRRGISEPRRKSSSPAYWKYP
jgi:hypothetical protein